jgi:putative acetyltransferase
MHDPHPSHLIRDEVPGDAAAIAAVLAAAFEPVAGSPPAETELVAALRAAGALSLSLVAEAPDGTLVGHIAFSPVTVGGPSEGSGEGSGADSGAGRLLGLAPLAVLPSWQGHGVGTELVEAGLAGARAAGAALVFVLGEPAYYRRFGFRSAAERGIAWEHAAPAEAFMALALAPGAGAAPRGVLRYHAAFDRFAE